MCEKKELPSETWLVSSLKQKSESTYNYLYKQYSGTLLGVISRIVQDKDIAQDILQEAMIKIWDNIDSYSPTKGRLFTWMLNVSRNLAIDKLRSKDYRNDHRTDDLQDNVAVIDHMKSNTTNTDIIGLKLLAEKLEPQLFSVLDMVYFKGYTHVETAEEMELPLGTVKTRIRYAILELRKHFAYHALKSANLIKEDEPIFTVPEKSTQDTEVTIISQWKKILDAVYYNNFTPEKIAVILEIKVKEARKLSKMSLAELKKQFRDI